jgi:hypothetical protein
MGQRIFRPKKLPYILEANKCRRTLITMLNTVHLSQSPSWAFPSVSVRTKRIDIDNNSCHFFKTYLGQALFTDESCGFSLQVISWHLCSHFLHMAKLQKLNKVSQSLSRQCLNVSKSDKTIVFPLHHPAFLSESYFQIGDSSQVNYLYIYIIRYICVYIEREILHYSPLEDCTVSRLGEWILTIFLGIDLSYVSYYLCDYMTLTIVELLNLFVPQFLHL